MSRIETRLAELDESLPEPKKPVANYVGCKQVGNALYVSARVSSVRGELGTELSLEDGQVAARGALLDLLAIVKEHVGDLDRIVSIDKMTGFVRSAPAFDQQPKVIDGASDLLIELWGEAGRHARTATSVAALPFGAAVQLEMIVTLA